MDLQKLFLQHQLLGQELEKSKQIREEVKSIIQRDLEDQIEEEYRAQGRVYQRTDIINSNNMSTSSQPIVVQDVLDLLKKGYTRLSKDDRGYGSIQNHYGLTGIQIKELFSHPKLKMRKTILPKPSLNIVDDEETETVRDEAPQEIVDNVSAIIERAEQDVVETKSSVNKEELFS